MLDLSNRPRFAIQLDLCDCPHKHVQAMIPYQVPYLYCNERYHQVSSTVVVIKMCRFSFLGFAKITHSLLRMSLLL